jgi:hypothetical protein
MGPALPALTQGGVTGMAKRSAHGCRSRGDYEVGYGKPPAATRFQKGQSGNPRGRPRGSRSMGAILDEILERKVTLRDRAGDRRVTAQEAMILKLVEIALKGDPRAFNMIVALADRYRETPTQTMGPMQLAAEDEAIIRRYLDRRADPQLECDNAD